MTEKFVEMCPVAGIEVKIEAAQRLVVIHLPYLTGFATPQQKEHQERAYCFLPEQAEILRDSLTKALDLLSTGDGPAPQH